MRSTKRALGDLVGDVRTAVWLGRRISRLWTGSAPWHSRSRAALHRLPGLGR